MASKKEVEQILDDAARALVTAISAEDVPVSEKTSALKALTTYYSTRFKKEAPPAAPKQAGPDFASFQQDVQEADDGEPELRTN